METFGTRLQKLRKEKQLSQEKFAEIMDVSRQSISKWENDEAYPEMNKLIIISRFFNVSMDCLVLGDNTADSVLQESSTQSKTDSLVKSVNSLFTNLNNEQKLILGIFTLAAFAIIVAFFFGAGVVTGKFLRLILKN